MAVALGCVPSMLMVLVGWAVGAAWLPGWAVLVVWALSGASAAYALRRSLALVEAFACGLSDSCALRIYAGALGGAALLGALISRMDALAAMVATCALIPLALGLLPQGRLSLVPRTEQSRMLSRAARVKPPARIGLIMGCLVVVGLVLGFQTSLGDALYTAWGRPTLVYGVLLLATVVLGAGVGALPFTVWRSATQVMCALCVVAIVPMLFLTYEPSNIVWLLCQNGLLLCTNCLLGMLGFALARGGFGTARETDGRPGLMGAVLFLVALVGGRLLGVLLARNVGVGSTPFEIAIVVFSALLLASMFVLNWGWPQMAPVASSAPPEETPEAALAAEAAGGAETPSEASVPVEAPVPQPKAIPGDPDAPPLIRRCNEVAWRYGLSEREHDVLILLARGLNAQQVADRMVVSRNTVKSHMAHIYSKLSIHTRAELDALLKPPTVEDETPSLTLEDGAVS